MYITPVTLQQANHFAFKNCKQYQAVDEQVFSIGCAVREKLRGVQGLPPGVQKAIRMDQVRAAGAGRVLCLE